jgi:hypothetical protein
LVGFFAGAVLLALGQVAFAAVRSPLIRAAIALLFAAPATVAGYHATLGVAHIGVPKPDAAVSTGLLARERISATLIG